jgi:hypothetical protein
MTGFGKSTLAMYLKICVRGLPNGERAGIYRLRLTQSATVIEHVLGGTF